MEFLKRLLKLLLPEKRRLRISTKRGLKENISDRGLRYLKNLRTKQNRTMTIVEVYKIKHSFDRVKYFEDKKNAVDFHNKKNLDGTYREGGYGKDMDSHVPKVPAIKTKDGRYFLLQSEITVN